MDFNKALNESLVKKIRIKRLEKGYTQAQLANAVDISPIIYSHIENGRREIKLLELIDIHDHLGISFQENLEEALQGLRKIGKPIDSTKRKSKIVGFTSFKGGMRVSTLAMIFCNKIAESNKVLLIDVGIQTSCYNLRKLDLKVSPGTNPSYEIKAMKTEDLVNQLDSLKEKYDFIVLDLPQFFLISNWLEDILAKCHDVFVPFTYWSSQERRQNEESFFSYTEGKLDLFVDLVKRVRNQTPEINFSMISNDSMISVQFKEWFFSQNIDVMDESFKNHEELKFKVDTLTSWTKNDDISYAPYINDTLRLLYCMEKKTGANLYIRSQEELIRKQLKQRHIENRD